MGGTVRPKGRSGPAAFALPARLGAALAVAAVVFGCSGLPAPESPAPGSPAPEAADWGVVTPGLSETEEEPWRWALVIDASSSASSLEIFQWRPGKLLPRIEPAPYPLAPGGEPWEAKVRPGLSAYAGRADEAARSLLPLLQFAAANVPAGEHARTSVYLRATAGLRLLGEDEQAAILGAVSGLLDESPFGASSAGVISGTEEGIFGWLAVNYLLGHLEHGGAFPTVGALDLGGGSTQITFVPLDLPRQGLVELRIGGKTYPLYSHSYLGLGQDVARDAVASNACFPAGYPVDGLGTGTGDFDDCRTAIREALAQPCEDEPCTLFGVYQPPLYGDFLAFSAYAYTADFLALDGAIDSQALSERGREFCAGSWQDLVAEDPEVADNLFVPRYCFGAAYAATLLEDVFGFPADSDRVHAPFRVQGRKVGWTLGALLFELAGDR